jgi:hypothetical protein
MLQYTKNMYQSDWPPAFINNFKLQMPRADHKQLHSIFTTVALNFHNTIVPCKQEILEKTYGKKCLLTLNIKAGITRPYWGHRISTLIYIFTFSSNAIVRSIIGQYTHTGNRC